MLDVENLPSFNMNISVVDRRRIKTSKAQTLNFTNLLPLKMKQKT